MRFRILAVLVLIAISALTLSLIHGQDGPQLPSTPGKSAPPRSAAMPAGRPARPGGLIKQASHVEKAEAARPLRDLNTMSELQKQMMFIAQRGADWMFRMHGVKGRFVHGYLPALQQPLEGDHYLRQAGAAFALARAARFTGERRYAVRATQAILALLEDTALDSADATVRYTTLPPGLVNRLGSAGLLVMAINELPSPQKDLLEQSEQLCNYIRKQVRPDGSLAYQDGKTEDEGINDHPGAAMYGLLLSQRHRPTDWKVALVRKALPYYQTWWKKNPSPDFVPLMSATYAELHMRTKDRACGDFVCEMSDWLCALQYAKIEPRRLAWYGGFMTWRDGQAIETAPTVACACNVEALVEACRVARDLADVPRFQRYSETVERGLQFLATLQYTEAVTQHFADWYRPKVVGAFRHSLQDGNLRIDHTQHAVAALFGYLEHVGH